MKLLKILSGSLILYFLFFATSTQVSSCVKEKTIYDTVTIRDTTIIRDTVDCDCYDLKDGLVAWYNFNGGTLNDSSGYNNHIVFNNAVKTTDRFGRANGAYLFNGTNSYMRVANSASINPTSAITLAAIVKVNGFYSGLCKGNMLISKTIDKDYGDGFYSLRFVNHPTDCNAPLDEQHHYFSGTYGNFYSGGENDAPADTAYVKKSTWYHVVYTYENGVGKLYINGELKRVHNDPAVFTPNTAELYLGRMVSTQYPYFFNGVMDDVRIYNRALCLGEVKQLNRVKD
ncbi:MAG: LamG domain-containing protein [Niastella sp.]|nr:LamG domain-containing protein [Niastella sp.]